MMNYEMSPNPADSWDLAKALTLVGAVASFLGLLASNDSRLRRTLGTIGTYLSVARAVVHVIEPPRCRICNSRSIKDGTSWFCPNGHGIA